jgi:hypothetical protein
MAAIVRVRAFSCWQFRRPYERVKMIDEDLIDAVAKQENPVSGVLRCCAAELPAILQFARFQDFTSNHGSAPAVN